jgi:hypothetical protein
LGKIGQGRYNKVRVPALLGAIYCIPMTRFGLAARKNNINSKRSASAKLSQPEMAINQRTNKKFQRKKLFKNRFKRFRAFNTSFRSYEMAKKNFQNTQKFSGATTNDLSNEKTTSELMGTLIHIASSSYMYCHTNFKFLQLKR